MPQPASFTDLVEGVKALFDAADDELGQFDLTPGGVSPWVATGVSEGHWWGEVVRTKHQVVTNPGSNNTMTARRTCYVLVEGWLIKSSTNNSDATWRDMQDTALTLLENKRYLAGAFLERSPAVIEDNEAIKSSLNQGDLSVLCHHCMIALQYVQEYSFTTQ